jgi:hypothetical protein
MTGFKLLSNADATDLILLENDGRHLHILGGVIDTTNVSSIRQTWHPQGVLRQDKNAIEEEFRMLCASVQTLQAVQEWAFVTRSLDFHETWQDYGVQRFCRRLEISAKMLSTNTTNYGMTENHRCFL